METETQKESTLVTDKGPETQESNSSQCTIADKIVKGTLVFFRKH